jgi:Zn-dependent protease/predicted transcriptional regulator
MFGRSFKVARIFGIAIEIHPSWLVILAFLSYSLSDGFFPDQYERWSTAAYWAVGTSAAVLLFVTVLIHELSHALVARRRGLPVNRITLFIFGGVSHLERQPASAGEEFQIAVAGPAMSLLIGILTGAAGLLLGGLNEKAEALLLYLAVVNLLLAFFNIIPGFPLDGGRVFRSIIWRRTRSFRRATRIAGNVGELVGYGMIGVGALALLGGFLFDGLWLMLIGWFLLGAARGETQGMQLEAILGKLTARDVMRETFVNVTPGISVQEVVDDYMVGQGERAVMVANDGAVLGILTVDDVRKVPREQWGQVPAQRIMTPREEVVTVTANARAVDVLMLLSEKHLNQVPVLDEGRMIGMVTRRELLERLQLAETLGPKPDLDAQPPLSPPEGPPAGPG